ncbi:ABC transporter substrate-binding protein [Natrialba swarupiae]|uniref:Solute-binding protein family 5 domain-containing protein n=1 Tax=Natrialba swarupiae TaxID=2448032 RepID=A0A5D5AS09_9EURY|nr:ABC transporter substrate-binding protein [Natrialba swarupiae]TYT62612.1 hypothetical protein FYC77_07545 [Natrialba swarupiae]
MVVSKSQDEESSIDRRKLLSALGATAVTGIAGCTGDSEDEDLGERVPTIVFEWWSGLGGFSQIQENAAPVIQENIEELGVDVELEGTEGVTAWVNIINDERNANLAFVHTGNNPNRLDPHETTRRFAADYAGPEAGANPGNYTNCEYTDVAVEQETVETVEGREELINQAQSIVSEDAMVYPMYATPSFGAIRTDEVDPDGIGAGGVDFTMPHAYIRSTPRTGDQISGNMHADGAQSLNYLAMPNAETLAFWSQIPHSPLVGYNEDYEIENVLAEDYEVTNGGQTFTVELRDGTFHNGDPITAEDVQFTYETLDENTDVFPHASSIPFESIEIIDETTVEFNTTEPFLPLTTSEWPRWGIIHKDSWQDAGVEETPTSLDFDEFIGSGPFQIEDFRPNESIYFSPHTDHPVYSPDHDLILSVYADAQSAQQAFENNEIQIISQIGPGAADQIEESMGDEADIIVTEGHMTQSVYPQYSFGPTKFHAFRDAVGKCFDRELIAEVALRGRGEPDTHASYLGQPHPWRAPDDMLYEYTDDISGDIDAAREALSEAGWEWDSNGNLRYPNDADLSPRWPEGEAPDPEDFPCLDDL